MSSSIVIPASTPLAIYTASTAIPYRKEDNTPHNTGWAMLTFKTPVRAITPSVNLFRSHAASSNAGFNYRLNGNSIQALWRLSNDTFSFTFDSQYDAGLIRTVFMRCDLGSLGNEVFEVYKDGVLASSVEASHDPDPGNYLPVTFWDGGTAPGLECYPTIMGLDQAQAAHSNKELEIYEAAFGLGGLPTPAQIANYQAGDDISGFPGFLWGTHADGANGAYADRFVDYGSGNDSILIQGSSSGDSDAPYFVSSISSEPTVFGVTTAELHRVTGVVDGQATLELLDAGATVTARILSLTGNEILEPSEYTASSQRSITITSESLESHLGDQVDVEILLSPGEVARSRLTVWGE